MSGITDFAQKILGVVGLGRGMDYETWDSYQVFQQVWDW
jgi:hypothetical protein